MFEVNFIVRIYQKLRYHGLPNSCWCHGVEIRRYPALTRELDVPLPPLFRYDRKISKQNFSSLSADENSKKEKLKNWIELPNPGSAKDLNKTEVTRMKDFETEVKDLPKFDFENFQTLLLYLLLSLLLLLLLLLLLVLLLLLLLIIIIIIFFSSKNSYYFSTKKTLEWKPITHKLHLLSYQGSRDVDTKLKIKWNKSLLNFRYNFN